MIIATATAAASLVCALADTSHTKIKPVPLFGGDTDQGFGGGAHVALTHTAEGYDPYAYDISLSGLVTFRDEGKLTPGHQDYLLAWKVPDALSKRALSIEGRLEYVDEILWWYGVGNASQFEETWRAFDRSTQKEQFLAARRFWQYRRRWATVKMAVRTKLYEKLFFEQTNAFTFNRMDAEQDSLVVQQGKLGPQEHYTYVWEGLVTFDSRDDETDPHRGQWIAAGPRVAPGGHDPFPYAWAGGVVNARVYLPIVSDYVTLAGRLVFDALFGPSIPFYELPKWSGGYAIGGMAGVRGVPGQRYAGELKTFGNVELRTRLARFQMFGSKARFGIAAFFDAGRVFTTKEGSQADGNEIGLKYGAGGGLRLRWGEALLLRLDVAWSPDARPIGVYFSPSQAF